MNLPILLITIIIICSLAIWQEVQKSWPVIYVKRYKDRLREEACDITHQAFRIEHRMQLRAKRIMDRELGKSHISELAK